VVQNNLPTDEPADFARALFGLLHHDPDVVASGEVDKGETIEALLECALMGHQVFATLHAEECASALVRLANVSAASTFLASAGLVVVAQRLVRKVCPHCASVYVPPREIMQQFYVPGFDPDTVDFRQGDGCQECRGAGLRGRVGIFELFTVDAETRNVLMQKPSAREVMHIIRKAPGFLSLKQAGFLKAVRGVTTLEEVLRVTPALSLSAAADEQTDFAELCRRAGISAARSTESENGDVADMERPEES
jgi:type II secretory ATPase GspE/PulE/Tfp pilus assembly ATPase PilB-like protein